MRISYPKACDHLEAQHLATDGAVSGGLYSVEFDSGATAEVELEMRNGIARLVWSS